MRAAGEKLYNKRCSVRTYAIDVEYGISPVSFGRAFGMLLWVFNLVKLINR